MNNKLFIISIIFVSLISVCSFQVQAQESTDDADVQETIKERLKKVVDEKKDQIKGITSGQEVKGFIGTIKRVSEETVTVESRRGTLIIPVSEGVSIVQEGKAFKLSDIEIDSQVTVIGYQDGDEFTAKRILVHKTKIPAQQKSIAIGNVQKIDKTSITIKTRQGEDKVFSFTAKTPFENMLGDTIKVASIEESFDVVIISIAEDEKAQAVKDSSGRIVKLRSLADPSADGEEQ